MREVSVTLEPIEGRRGRARLRVEDDSPDGFRDLAHAYTLFAPSRKKADAEKRGRYNFGEKLVLAFCDEATIQSTTGGVCFDSSGSRRKTRNRREAGTVFEAIIRLTREEIQEVSRQVFTLIPPLGVRTDFNGQEIVQRQPVEEFEVSLATEYANEDGQLRSTRRKTIVRLYEALAGEVPSIYEMGIPVVEVEGAWHIDVQQKVPLNMDRDNVTPGYLKELQTWVLNKMATRMPEQEILSSWVTEAMGSQNINDDAVRAVITGRFGNKAVVHDPSDPEANKLAYAAGYSVISGGALPKEAWANVRRARVVLPAGQVTPSGKGPSSGSGGVAPIPEEQWSHGMSQVAAYAREFARLVIDRRIDVEIYRLPNCKCLAWYGPGGPLGFNLSRLGSRWFEQAEEHKVDELMIHELAHEYASDHLSREYYDALCRVGARLKSVASQLQFNPTGREPAGRATQRR